MVRSGRQTCLWAVGLKFGFALCVFYGEVQWYLVEVIHGEYFVSVLYLDTLDGAQMSQILLCQTQDSVARAYIKAVCVGGAHPIAVTRCLGLEPSPPVSLLKQSRQVTVPSASSGAQTGGTKSL